MGAKQTYETCAAIAAALPDAEREQFADLVGRLAAPTTPNVATYATVRAVRRQEGAVRQWLRDAGWVKR